MQDRGYGTRPQSMANRHMEHPHERPQTVSTSSLGVRHLKKVSSVVTSSPSTDPLAGSLQVGCMIEHERFGIGRVQEVVGAINPDSPIATATGTENPLYPGEGWLRMIGVGKAARGLGAGRAVVLSALHALKDSGYKTARLSTDDFRIPAISLYLSLGFEPVFEHDSHEARWKAIFFELERRAKKK